MVAWMVSQRFDEEGLHLCCIIEDAVDCIHLGGGDLGRGSKVFLCSRFVGFLRMCSNRVNYSAEVVDIRFSAGHITT